MTGAGSNFQSEWIRNLWKNLFVRLAVFALAYSIAFEIGLRVIALPERISLLWPATGIALAYLLLRPRREWPVILGTISGLNLILNLLYHNSLLLSLWYAVFNSLEPGLEAWVMARLRGERVAFARLGDMVALIFIITIVNAATTTLGAFVPVLLLKNSYVDVWQLWWIANGLGILVMTPLLATWAIDRPLLPRRSLLELIEVTGWFVILCVSAWLVFGVSPLNISLELRPYMLFPVLIWGALRFSPRASATGVLLLSIIALVNTVEGRGSFPLGGDAPIVRALGVQSYLWIASITAMLLSISFRERKHAGDAIEQSEKRFRSMVENGGDAVTLIGADGKVLYEGPTVERITGYQSKDRIGKSGFETLHPEDLPKIRKTLGNVIGNPGKAVRAEFRAVKPDGTVWWAEGTATNMLNEPSVRAIVINYRDVTERKQAEERLRQSEERYQAFISQSFEGISRTEFDHPVDISLPVETQIDLIYENAYMAECNQALADMYGISSCNEMIGARLVDAHGGKDNPVNRAAFRKFIENGYKSINDETFEYDTNGNPVWFLSNTIGTVESGHLVRLWGTALVITERKRAETELLESRKRLQDVVNAAPYGAHTYELHSDGRLVFMGANRSADIILGVDNRQFVGKTIEEAFPALSETEIPAAYRRVAATGEPYYQEQVAYNEQGIAGAYEVHGMQISPNMMTAFFTDVTERKRAERERERLLQELAQKNKELESLVYIASHDLRSPLVNIQGFGKNLQKYFSQLSDILGSVDSLDEFRSTAQPILAERIPSALRFIEISSVKMDSLTDGLLRLSRVGRMLLQMAPLDTNKMIQGILDTMAFQIEKAQARIEVEQPLAGCFGDRNQLNQVFSNLIDNAVKYRDPERPLVIRIFSRINSGKVTYTITDNGLGIAPENQNRIWELFSRLDSNKEIPGEGLGLAIAHRIIERHNGRIWVESESGVGSRFHIELPARG